MNRCIPYPEMGLDELLINLQELVKGKDLRSIRRPEVPLGDSCVGFFVECLRDIQTGSNTAHMLLTSQMSSFTTAFPGLNTNAFTFHVCEGVVELVEKGMDFGQLEGSYPDVLYRLESKLKSLG